MGCLIYFVQLEEISKFLMPGQYNNMTWFYQEVDEDLDNAVIPEEEDLEAKVSTNFIVCCVKMGDGEESTG